MSMYKEVQTSPTPPTSQTPSLTRLFGLLLVLVAGLALVGCGEIGTPPPNVPTTVENMSFGIIDSSVPATTNDLKKLLGAKPNTTIMAEVKHHDNAKKAGMSLRPTTTVYLGNPRLEAPMIKKNQLFGMAYPRSILVFTKDGDKAFALMSDRRNFVGRYGYGSLTSLNKTFSLMQGLMDQLADQEPTSTSSRDIPLNTGMLTLNSSFDVETTSRLLRQQVKNNPNLSMMFEVNHDKRAADIGIALRPTRLFVFGNPKVGTVLMQAKREIALDLPVKMLVWKDAAGAVRVTYNAPLYLASRHRVPMTAKVRQTLKTMETGLLALARQITTIPQVDTD